jgi:hypothetical protein
MVNGSIHNPEVLLIPDLVKQEQHCFSEIFQIYLQARAQGSRAAQITNRTTFGGSFQSRSLRELQGIASVTGIVQCVIQKARKHANARTTAEELKGRSASYRTLLQLSEAIETDIEEQADAWGLRLQLRRGLIDNGLAAIHQQCKVFEIEAKLAGGGDGAPREEGKCVV